MMRHLPDALCFLTASEVAKQARNGLLGLRDAVRDVRLRPELSIVEVTADNMREISGVMARVLDALGKAGVEPLQFADSHKALCILTLDSQAGAALAALKQEFSL
jgi:aspartokinase